MVLSALVTACGGGGDAAANTNQDANQSALTGNSGSAQTADSGTQSQAQTQTAVTMSLTDLPYKDPQPLVDFMAMNDADYQAQLSGNWPYVENLLHQYIPANVQLYPVSLGFYGPMQSCLQQHGLAACREYMNSLIGLMRSKQSGTS